MGAGDGGRDLGVDVLKGVAMVGVLLQHAGLGQVWHDTGGNLHVLQAMPIFLVLLGWNATRSSDRRPDAPLRERYGAGYWRSRASRLLVPFLVVWIVAFGLGLVTGELELDRLTLVGVLPVRGPGNYFVWVLLGFTLLFPLVHRWFVRRPLATVAGALAVNLAVDVAVGVLDLREEVPSLAYVIDGDVLRLGGAVLLGALLVRTGGRVPGWLRVGAAVSGALLVLEWLVPSRFTWLPTGFARATGSIAACYVAVLVAALLPMLRRLGATPAGAALGAVGEASYHVFLVQIVWFGLAATAGAVGWAWLPLNLVAPVVLGVAFFRAHSTVLAQLAARNRAAVAAAS